MKSRNLTLAAALVLALAGLTAAKSGDKAGALTTGGRTVAGPGTATAITGAGAKSFVNGNKLFDGCMTVINVGSAPAELGLQGSGTSSVGVDPGETRVLCHEDMGSATLTCLGTGSDSCTVQWRLDAA
jgi:hypothetical protein